MESPYNRPVAANLIKKAFEDWTVSMNQPSFFCGFSREMCVYTALKEAGFLTTEAMIPDEK